MVNTLHLQVQLKTTLVNCNLQDGVVADDAHLNTMMYYVEGIDATVPGNKHDSSY